MALAHTSCQSAPLGSRQSWLLQTTRLLQARQRFARMASAARQAVLQLVRRAQQRVHLPCRIKT